MRLWGLVIRLLVDRELYVQTQMLRVVLLNFYSGQWNRAKDFSWKNICRWWLILYFTLDLSNFGIKHNRYNIYSAGICYGCYLLYHLNTRTHQNTYLLNWLTLILSIYMYLLLVFFLCVYRKYNRCLSTQNTNSPFSWYDNVF